MLVLLRDGPARRRLAALLREHGARARRASSRPSRSRTRRPSWRALRPQFLGYGLGLGDRATTAATRCVQHIGRPARLRVARPARARARARHRGADQPGVGRGLRRDHLRVLDHSLGAPRTDWLAAFQKAEAREQRADGGSGAQDAGARATPASRPSLPLAGYAGDLRRRLVRRRRRSRCEGGKLVMRFATRRALVGDLEHWQHDTFVARWRDRELRADAFVTFALDPRRQDRPGQDARGLARDRLQLRLPGPAAAADALLALSVLCAVSQAGWPEEPGGPILDG